VTYLLNLAQVTGFSDKNEFKSDLSLKLVFIFNSKLN